MENDQNITIGLLLNGKNFGRFKNDQNEFCTVTRYYVKNQVKYQIVFSDESPNSIAYKPAIRTTSEKKVLKVLFDNKFNLVFNK